MSAMKPAEATRLLQKVTGYYAKTLWNDPAGMRYLQSLKLTEAALLETFQIGYSSGNLLGLLPKAGEAIETLQALGVLNAQGQEHFSGCVTVPLFGAVGAVCGLHGRRIRDDETIEVNFSGLAPGVFNGVAAKTCQSLYLTSTVFDALSLWQAGFRNVLGLKGPEGWSECHDRLFKENGITEVVLCLGNDGAGKATTTWLKEEVLPKLVKTVRVIQWPDSVTGALAFFQKRAARDFETLVQEAIPHVSATGKPAEQTHANKVELTPTGFLAEYGPRKYDVRAIEKPSLARLKGTIRATGPQGKFVIDTVDFYAGRSRRSFISETARLFRETVEVVETDLNRLTELVEAEVQRRLSQGPSAVITLSDADKADGLRLGRNQDLMNEILRDLEKLGTIGEDANKQIGYLVMTSRKMTHPLSLLILSGSGAGKSHLQDAIVSLCPEEDLVKLTALTDRALFYKGGDSLKHKVLAVEELVGAQGADYAIRNLISARKLVVESTVKNPLTGKLETQLNTVHGPTAVFQTTTNPRTDAETRSRFLVVSADESPEQTKAILQVQRQSHTLAGWRQQQEQAAILRRHHAFQRLLKPLVVINPFEPLLSYPDDHLLVRRDHPKYLQLILAVTFLYQMQRCLKQDVVLGDYVEATLDDIALANDLAHQVLGHSLDDLSHPARELLRLITRYAQSQAAHSPVDQLTFNRRQLREAIKWGDTRLRTHLAELVSMEHLLPICGRFGKTYQYRLSSWPKPDADGPRFLAGIKSVAQLRSEAHLAGLNPNLAGGKGHLAPTSPAPIREVPDAASPSNDKDLPTPAPNLAPAPGGTNRRGAKVRL
jgi:DNA primase